MYIFEKGFTLFEVLLALGVISFAMVGISAYQLKAMDYAKAAYLQNIAVNQLQESVWLTQHHFNLAENLILPHMNYQQTQDNLALIWSSPILTWHCDQAEKNHYSCLSLNLI